MFTLFIWVDINLVVCFENPRKEVGLESWCIILMLVGEHHAADVIVALRTAVAAFAGFVFSVRACALTLCDVSTSRP